MIKTLLHKEWRQHRLWTLIISIIFIFVALIASLAANATGSGAGVFYGLAFGLIIMVPISALVLSNLLVHSEFQNKTQLFLEGLPLQRWKMIAIKLAIAMACVCFYSIVSILIGWLFAGGSEAVTIRFLSILFTSACGFSAFVMGLFFVIGFMGRYRIFIILLLLILVIILQTMSPLSISDFPPFNLIKPSRFGLERDVFPVNSLAWTGLLTLGLIILAFILGTVKEGSIASLLGEKMSYKEKMFVGGSIGILFIVIMSFGKGPQPIPFSTPGAVHESWEGVNVYISSLETDKPVDLEVQIASRLARRLATQRDWLGIPADQFPTVYIVENNDLEDEERIKGEAIPDKNKVKMYAGIRQKGFSENRLLSWTLSEIFVKRSMKRVYEEERWWIVCGLEGLWEMEQADKATIEDRIQLAVETVIEHDLTVDTVMGWSKYQADADWRNADAVAWMGMKYLSETKGLKTVQNLAKATVVLQVNRKDSRPVYWHYANPVRQEFDRTTGLKLEQFVENWKAYILANQTDTKTQQAE